MLDKLRVQNFKGWKDTGEIKMAPITLFFGTNSSGKSSIGQFLMMLKQTIELPDRKTVFYAGGQNSAVQLGSYREMIFCRDQRNQITFDYEWSLPETLTIKDSLSEESYNANSIRFFGTVGLKNKAIQVLDFNYILSKENNKSLSIGLTRKRGKYEYKLSAEPNFLLRRRQRPWDIKNIIRFYGFPDEVSRYYQNADFVQDINLEHERLFSSISYLGPLRNEAKRLYTWGGGAPESVGFSGREAVAALLAARKRKISPGKRRQAKLFEEVIASQLKKMGLIKNFQIKAIASKRQEYEVKVRTQGSDEWVDLPDVGFGVSQVLPVLVQCFYAPPGSIIIMEQPEIHLHPSAQSALADVMIDVINSRENGKSRNIQLIIETHSEHFLRRLQRRIAEGDIPEKKVAAYFANTSKTPANLDPLQLNKYGNILNWPEGFFGDEMGDIVAQAEAALEKQIQADKKVGDSQ